MAAKILIVEDDTSIHSILEEILKQENYIVYNAYSGTEALMLLEKVQVDLILLDLVMPVKDGIYVLKEMRKQKIDKKVIVETSYNSPEVLSEVSNLGANYYILKPFDLDDLEERIITILNNETS